MSSIGAAPTADLEALAIAIERGQLGATVSATSLVSMRLAHLAEPLGQLLSLPAEALRLALQAIVNDRRARTAPAPELVWTGPETVSSSARDTSIVLREMFASAKSSVLVAGFSFDHGDEILRALQEAIALRGVRAAVFAHFDRCRKSATDLEAYARKCGAEFLRDCWSLGPPYPELYYDPRTLPSKSIVSMHAKCVVVDTSTAFITSANFTDRGQTRNIEVGVRIDDPAFARELEAHWWGLVSAGALREVIV